MVEPLILNFRAFTVKLVGVRKFRNFTVNTLSASCMTVLSILPECLKFASCFYSQANSFEF